MTNLVERITSSFVSEWMLGSDVIFSHDVAQVFRHFQDNYFPGKTKILIL